MTMKISKFWKYVNFREKMLDSDVAGSSILPIVVCYRKYVFDRGVEGGFTGCVRGGSGIRIVKPGYR